MTEITPLQARANEVAEYERTIAMFTAIAAALPSEWPDRLVQHKGATDKHAVIATITDLADVELVSDLWAHDDAQAAIRANTVEMRKAQAILNVMQLQA